MTFVGWGGVTKSVSADFNLGVAHRRNLPPYGIRRAIWDAAYGYVNGFPKRDILYYLLTRSLSQRIWHYTFLREYPERTSGCGGKVDRRTGKAVWCRICHPERVR